MTHIKGINRITVRSRDHLMKFKKGESVRGGKASTKKSKAVENSDVSSLFGTSST
jgi:hypothetical protein